MSTLVDTSILTRAVYKADPQHQLAVDSVDSLRKQNEQLCVVPQNFYELWVVCTRPIAQNGLGMSPAQVEAEIVQLECLFITLDDIAAIFPEWRRIVNQYKVSGKNGHDARLVAAMRVHRIAQILTFNTQDFQRYQGITVLSPKQVGTSP
ncbi:MAG TPA: type II toxin-antitoxin system VapC family toxin [Gemmataceae bacterium]|jgi:predicted nucleic acid-binding protein|nr:type II toxin-antitoxin system VapC family toxin [Gemmataceae bacterium]